MSPAGLFDLTGRRALVTGGTSGIGFAIARALGSAGAVVAVASDRAEDCTRAEADLRGAGLAATALHATLGPRDASHDLAARASEALCGPPDILVSNAGTEGPVGPMAEADPNAYAALFNVNLHSAFWLAAAIAPGMAEAGGGAMIFTASIAGLRGNAAIGPYGMTKAALIQLVRNLAVEHGPQNIRANAVAPGIIATGFAEALLNDDAFMARRLAATPLRRTGTAEEVAATALWLASAGGAFVTSQCIVVDGGTTITDGG